MIEKPREWQSASTNPSLWELDDEQYTIFYVLDNQVVTDHSGHPIHM